MMNKKDRKIKDGDNIVITLCPSFIYDTQSVTYTMIGHKTKNSILSYYSSSKFLCNIILEKIFCHLNYKCKSSVVCPSFSCNVKDITYIVLGKNLYIHLHLSLNKIEDYKTIDYQKYVKGIDGKVNIKNVNFTYSMLLQEVQDRLMEYVNEEFYVSSYKPISMKLERSHIKIEKHKV
ncbi:Hypothetical protein ORPV_213 [Orpheovirus IHUMI-LCC2]|uniref:Uncharacterized protein n=1 Tax=Orpheovirus IHUMI-LCC2 TaxID=2023057 RepID=A0A2I2L3M0_9VIRU|nr:Hypothetical protein ORPV_213 [Orpheovirus IHUMI-LCC2]SNW62117.1 Hypothetical protein ORPV_213 [Orpheovirus IHUMI-LCC2]